MRKYSRRASVVLLACGLALATTADSAQGPTDKAPVAEKPTVVSLIDSVLRAGVAIAYSSDLVPPTLRATAPAQGDLLSRLRAALAEHGLALRPVGPGSYVIARSTQSDGSTAGAFSVASESLESLQEVSVFASRYALQGRGFAGTRSLTGNNIQQIPGSHDDAVRALRSLPGIASNASGRPYVRGSLSGDVLYRFDGVPVLDPFHLKNFQSLISAIDPAAVDRIDVYSGGFPARYGTRSGGVVDIVPPNRDAGVEHAVAASLFAAGAASSGRSERWPVEWLVSARRSTLDLLEPVEKGFGKPEFQDSLARWRWHSESLGVWTLGWLLLNDRVRLGAAEDEELADARYRDGYVWLALDRPLGESWTMRSAVARTDARRSRNGAMNRLGVALGQVQETQQFDSTELLSDWTYTHTDANSLNLGMAFGHARAGYGYLRNVSFAPDLAAAFARPLRDDLVFHIAPESRTAAFHASQRWHKRRWETELGLRWDHQRFDPGDSHQQLSPRLNLRFDASERWRLHASAGRFTQAQRVEEWRVEAAQALPDPTIDSWHAVLGVDYLPDTANKWSLEIYGKRWSRVAPYFDTRFDPLALLPDLAPDRILLRPNDSEALGLELSVRSQLTERLAAWGSLSFARVADDFGAQDVLRSWDQPLALTAGVAWRGARGEVSALATWHSGWPRTPFRQLIAGAATADTLQLGARNTARWQDFLSIDLRATRQWTLNGGDLTAHLEITNASNRSNPCCISLERDDGIGPLLAETERWLPAVANIGLTYRWGSER